MNIPAIAFSCDPVADLARARAFCDGGLGLPPAVRLPWVMISDPDGNLLYIHEGKTGYY